MLVPVLVLKKYKKTLDQDWEKVEIGAIVKLSREASLAKIDFPDGTSSFFLNDNEALEALVRNGFSLTPESAYTVISQIPDASTNEYFKRLLPTEKG